MAYDNTNRGTLGRNKRREKDTQPEYTGKLNVDGTDYWLNAWVKESNGEKFFSLSVKPKEPLASQVSPKDSPKVAPKPADDLNDSIPF